MGADTSQGTHRIGPNEVTLITHGSNEERNGRLCCRTYPTQVQCRPGADPLVLILQHLYESADRIFLSGSKMRQSPHCLLPKGLVSVLKLLDPKTRRLAFVK